MISSKHWVVEGINEWKQITGGYNWYSFTLFQCYFEAGFIGGYEFHFTLLGLGFYIRYNTDKALKRFDEWDRELKEEFKDLV